MLSQALHRYAMLLGDPPIKGHPPRGERAPLRGPTYSLDSFRSLDQSIIYLSSFQGLPYPMVRGAYQMLGMRTELSRVQKTKEEQIKSTAKYHAEV